MPSSAQALFGLAPTFFLPQFSSFALFRARFFAFQQQQPPVIALAFASLPTQLQANAFQPAYLSNAGQPHPFWRDVLYSRRASSVFPFLGRRSCPFLFSFTISATSHAQILLMPRAIA